ncbi:hypothetical protein OG394_08825 [Kribbella sp. NBC_01245]|uniref:hypothetical protein n=1 Tax=Kribbella sp. NBC_01245 TaxID=2903578 RepID=UPI002E2E84AA|nr:hypothetical protein [Kribbella sp. NBC_01245]
MDDEMLVEELRALGRSIPSPDVAPGLTAAVLDRVALVEPGKASRWARLRSLWAGWVWRGWRKVVAVVVVVLAGLLAVPPVRATVADWFGIGGVVVRPMPGPGPSEASPPPTAGTGVTLAEAGKLAGFAPLVPTALGKPDGIEVSADRRVVSMSWGSGEKTIRLDQLEDRLSPYFEKQLHGTFELTRKGFWFETPHELHVVDSVGQAHMEPPRTAGRTLVWKTETRTFRLEGALTKDRALAIADSTG